MEKFKISSDEKLNRSVKRKHISNINHNVQQLEPITQYNSLRNETYKHVRKKCVFQSRWTKMFVIFNKRNIALHPTKKKRNVAVYINVNICTLNNQKRRTAG